MTGWIRACTGTVFASISAEFQQDGTPVKRFRKEIMRVGEYVKGDDRFGVTRDTLRHWAAQFARMKANGVKVPMPATHEAEGDPDLNRGWVTDMYVEGDSLLINCDLIGKDGIDCAKKADVSIKSPAKAPDGHGNEYVRPITHVAMCTDPVVPGLDAFIPIAASLAAKEKQTMKLKKTAKALGLKEAELTDDKADDLLCSAVKTLQGENEGLKKSETTLKGSEKALKLSLAELKKGTEAKEVQPLMLDLLTENRERKLDQLVECSRITPAVRDKIKAELLVPEALTLELSTGRKSEFDFWMKTLLENDPVKLREQTREQTTMELSNPNKGQDPDLVSKAMDARNKELAPA
jgi:hypothetical protein